GTGDSSGSQSAAVYSHGAVGPDSLFPEKVDLYPGTAAGYWRRACGKPSGRMAQRDAGPGNSAKALRGNAGIDWPAGSDLFRKRTEKHKVLKTAVIFSFDTVHL